MSDADVALLVEHNDSDEEEELEEPPWEVSSRQREVNYGRLCTLIIREGKEIM